jgi:acyl carrier protein
MKQTPDQISQQFSAILIEQLGINENDIKPEFELRAIGADSLDMVEMVMEVESTFGIDITDETAEGLTTVQSFLTLIETELA